MAAEAEPAFLVPLRRSKLVGFPVRLEPVDEPASRAFVTRILCGPYLGAPVSGASPSLEIADEGNMLYQRHNLTVKESNEGP